MKIISCILLTVISVSCEDACDTKTLPERRQPAGLTIDVVSTVERIITERGQTNYTEIFTTETKLISIFTNFEHVQPPQLVLNLGGKQKLISKGNIVEFISRTMQFTADGWMPSLFDCHLSHKFWLQPYRIRKDNHTVALMLAVELNRCDHSLDGYFGGSNRCHQDTTNCIPEYEHSYKRVSYWCSCKPGYYYALANSSWRGFYGEEIEDGSVQLPKCEPCPLKCDICEAGVCATKRSMYLKTIIIGVQLICMSITLIMALVVFNQRKSKTIASGMWTILETILLGIFLIYSTVIIRFFEPSTLQCILEPWARELGFVICYGAIILKLYRHLIEFRTRKAHRWVVKDTDLLKYLMIMIISLLAYMAAYTSLGLNFMQENYSLLRKSVTSDGLYYEECKPLYWDYVTECGELIVLVFGIHLGYATQNAKTQFHERNFLCAAIAIELTMSGLFYMARIFILSNLHPDTVLIAHCLRTQLTATLVLLVIFLPKFWYQQKQVRSLAQEYSCRFPVDAFKDVNAHGNLTSNNSDADLGEVTIADMSPDDIRSELKRLYIQLELFKSKTICRDNPHISKRRGGRKTPHRRFSLQKKGSRERNLYGKHKHQKQQEVTEAEQSRTPEDSVCSNEGPSAIYNDLPSSAPIDPRNVAL